MVLADPGWGHARHGEEPPSPHRDPFDHLLASQGQVENLSLVTTDADIRRYDRLLAAI